MSGLVGMEGRVGVCEGVCACSGVTSRPPAGPRCYFSLNLDWFEIRESSPWGNKTVIGKQDKGPSVHSSSDADVSKSFNEKLDPRTHFTVRTQFHTPRPKITA